MKIEEMTLADVEARLAEIETELETRSGEELDALKAEVVELQERKAILADLEQRQADAKALEEKRAEAQVTPIETRKEEKTMQKIEEYRNSEEYINAYADYIKTDWLKSGVLSLVKRISVQGNMKVQFELSAGDAVIHNEGSGAVSEEELTLGVVTLVPESIKKWISISDEVNDMKGEAFLRYIYDELTYKIARKAEAILIGKIKNLPTSATSSSVNAKKVKAGAALGTIATALGELNAEAQNPVILMNPATKAAFKAAVYAGHFNADPFEGLTVYLTNDLPAISAASENDVYAIVGDFGYGALANFPNGEATEIKYDDKTLMTEDLIKILGREYVAIEPIACRAFVNITAPAAG